MSAYPMLRNLVAVIAFLTVSPTAMQAQHQEPVRITLFRTGAATPTIVPTFVDGITITALANHRMVVFEVSPGKHELSAGTGANRVTCSFTSEGDKFLYAELSLRKSAAAQALLYDLRFVEEVDDGSTRVLTLSPTVRKHILQAAHPSVPEVN